MSLDLRFKLMRIIAVIFALYTVIWGLAPYTAINLPSRFLLDVLDWPIDNMAVALDQNTKWLSAIGASLLGAVSVFLWGIVAPALKRGDVEIAKTTLQAFIVWYVIDSAGSIAAGVPSNVVFNTAYLILVLIPLLGMPKNLNKPDKGG
ncbi:hypothetical protein [Leucothrix arctica]|uniref:Uncharacterized protein n=1 Tax=Leucothrix arctica TaxID=1481894 RepID=A0A317CN20_9GAMM|nr:hypothetical protein [Leucothrix arctica]PWQ99597.1 hypothetical protein DKT75_00570 [Leucothrix arctica]